MSQLYNSQESPFVQNNCHQRTNLTSKLTMSSNHIQIKYNDLEQGNPDVSGSTIVALLNQLCMCFTVTAIVLLFFTFVLIFPILFTPLLILSLLVIRLIQFIRYGNGLIRAARWKYYIHGSMLVSMEIFLFDMVFYYPMVKFTPGLKHVMILGLPFPNWLVIACEMCVFYVLGFLSSFFVHALMFSWIRSEHRNEYRVRVAESASEIIQCLIFWWGESELMKHVPVLKQSKILGMYTVEWINVTIFSLIGYNCIVVTTNVLVRLIHTLDDQHVDVLKHVKYYASGLGRSITFIMTSVMLLLIWVLYLGQQLSQKPGRISYVGTGTFVSLVMYSLLWLLKTCIVIAWEAQVIYGSSTFDSVTLTEVLGLLGFFDEWEPYSGLLGRLLSTLDGLFDDWNSISLMKKATLPLVIVPAAIVSELAEVAFVPSRYYYFKGELDDTTTYTKQLRALSLLQAKHRLEKYAPAPGSLFLRDFFHLDAPSIERVTIKRLEDLIRGRYKNDICVSKALKSLLRRYGSFGDPLPKEIPVAVLTKCLDQAIANLLTLANIVGSYREMVDCLDKIMSWAIIGATFIIWLLLTRLASTRILVIIATPLVAASFIFGDTCKTLFQGIVFVYAIRPFGVGDECNIGEDSPLRVTSIGVWKTVFSKTIKGTQVTVIYPNSELANKRVLISRKFHFEQLSEQETAGNEESTSDKTAPEESNKPTVPEAPTSNKPAALDVKDQTIWLLVDHEGSSKPVALDHEGSSKPPVPDLELPN